MQTTTLSCFRFETADTKLWAFGQLQFARGPLRRLPGVSFCKLMGSGTRRSFHPWPNFGVYAILMVWPSEKAARVGLTESRVFQRYCARATESLTVFVQAEHARGTWDGRPPFEVGTDQASESGPIGVLTRATLRMNRLVDFWRSVPAVNDSLGRRESLLFGLGMGEVPWLHQVTFSIWRDVEAMREFAYRSGAHREAIRRSRHGQWFREELFARFRIVGAEGTWDGRSPLGAGWCTYRPAGDFGFDRHGAVSRRSQGFFGRRDSNGVARGPSFRALSSGRMSSLAGAVSR